MSNVASLLTRDEGTKCDFKRAPYKLPDEKTELAKDISALANSTRRFDGDSFVILGFDRLNGAFYDVSSLIQQGESQIQQMVNSLIDPPVEFKMEVASHKTESAQGEIVIFCVPHSTRKPHLIRKDRAAAVKGRSLYQGQCFVRRGSCTEVASREEIAEIVHDADGTFSPILRVMKYVESVQRTGHQIKAEELKELLTDNDLVPSFSAPLQVSLSCVTTNSEGMHVTRTPIPGHEVQRQISLINDAAAAYDTGDTALARLLFEKVPGIQESINACLVGIAIYTRLGEKELGEPLLSRAFELEPALPEVNARAAEFCSRFDALGDCLIYCERGIERINATTHVDVVKQLWYLSGVTCHSAGISSRAQSCMTHFLELHSEEDDCRRLALSIVEKV